ncbi:sulfonate ABC transporter substrate-binding protein [Aliarcobacter butzleri]|uniref:sulfonate ABC transporter substrate-binding protein n=1 Tax=Aliarcobacter butzleri TaxID=28197 RepID=UPI00263EBCFE|nr:sulfonate ABC transporter substrate-binding protein [Aliarcobacter butzleri]MDN5101080.1 sulfonate ABC transporter substrate-binding protein [Aliarcobacter butzleri]
MRKIIKKIVATLAIIPVLSFGATEAKQLRIGYQKSDPGFILLKSSGELEKKLEPIGVKVTWIEFPAGPQLLEGLNVGSIDLGTVGETPPIFAQAANAKIKYIGYKSAFPKAEAIIVPKDSSIKTVSDLKGKKVALNKGSNVHYLLVKALEEAGLKYSDIQPTFLPPADARAAFEKGSVDAWVIWDPFYAAAELKIGAKNLRDGVNLVNNYQFYLVEESYIKNKEIIDLVFNEIKKVDELLTKDPSGTAKTLSSINGLDVEALELAHKRAIFTTQYLTPKIIQDQQEIADTFYDLKLIPKKLDIKSVVWTPENSK